MLSFLNMECVSCAAEYTLSIEELNVMVLFKCFECGRHHVYVAGHVLELDDRIMETGTDEEKRLHIVETTQTFACEFAGNVIGNVDRVVNVNVEADLPPTRRRKKKGRKAKRGAKKRLAGRRLSPSIKLVDAPEISSQEVRDFKRIDLELIDKKAFFDRFFGRSNN